jgi:hypothetical protein
MGKKKQPIRNRQHLSTDNVLDVRKAEKKRNLKNLQKIFKRIFFA